MTKTIFMGYCEELGAPCEYCDMDGSCTAEECTEGYLTEEKDE